MPGKNEIDLLVFETSAVYNEFTRTRSRNTLVTFGLSVQR